MIFVTRAGIGLFGDAGKVEEWEQIVDDRGVPVIQPQVGKYGGACCVQLAQEPVAS